MASFYRQFGWPEAPTSVPEHVVFQCSHGVVLGLFSELRFEPEFGGSAEGFRAFTLTIHCEDEEEVVRAHQQLAEFDDVAELDPEIRRSGWGYGFSFRDPEERLGRRTEVRLALRRPRRLHLPLTHPGQRPMSYGSPSGLPSRATSTRGGGGRRERSHAMPRYLISFDAHAMDHIPAEDMPAVTDASLAVVQEAIDAGVWVFGGGLEHQKASIVATGGRVIDGAYPEAIGGLCVVDVPSREEALEWAARIAVACRCAQEVREFMPDPTVGS